MSNTSFHSSHLSSDAASAEMASSGEDKANVPEAVETSLSQIYFHPNVTEVHQTHASHSVVGAFAKETL